MMQKYKPVSGTKFRWNRNWTFYRVNAVLSESKTEVPWPFLDPNVVEAYQADLQPDWTAYLLELTAPIITERSLSSIIITDKIRIYPPFWLNKKSSITHSFDEVLLPSSPAEGRIPIPNYAVRGAMTELNLSNAIPMYGIRLDCSKGIEIDEFMSFFLSLVRQYTKQWWVASPRNPFDAGLRMAIELRKNFRPREPLFAKGAGNVSAPWFGSAATQNLVGFERELDSACWLDVGKCVRQGHGLEPALKFYLDAVADYMGYQDHHCILSLALLFEVAENKCLLMEGKAAKSKNKNILREPLSAKGRLKETFRKIITDRDNIAHGRAPSHYRADFIVILEYLEAASEFVNSYLDRCRAYGWDKSVRLSI